MKRYKTTNEYVYDAVRQAIVELELKPGEKIDQDQLADQLQVSKMPLRTAFERLQAEGLVEIQSHRGVFITSLSYEHLNDIIATRHAVEILALELAASNLRPADFDALRKVIEECRLAVKREDWARVLELNASFHLGLYQRAQRPVLFDTISRLWYQNERYRQVFVREHNGVAGTTLDDHHAILDALEAQQVAKAKEILNQHEAHYYLDPEAVMASIHAAG